MLTRSSAIIFALAVFLFSAALGAAPKDKAANKKIDEAINTHYLATDFDKAEAVLVAITKACGDKCSGPVLARAWMYIGVVRGSAKNDRDGSIEAFKKALGYDPNVKLDAQIASEETKAAFEEVAGKSGGTPTPPDKPDTPDKPDKPTGTEGAMDCTPKVTEVETRRPIPVQCTTEEEAVGGEIKFKEFGSDKWQAIPLQKKGDFFVGIIPCTANMDAGTLRFYVRVQDAAGDTIDNYGTKRKPVSLSIVSKSGQEPPAFEGEGPPDRCPEKEICPPGLPGCNAAGGAGQPRGDKGWGASCASTPECKAGLACVNGSCESAAGSCQSNADCADGTCEGGQCVEASGPSGPYKKNWIGLHFGLDMAFTGGSNVCSADSQANKGFTCFLEGSETQYTTGTRPDFPLAEPQPGQGNNINDGLALGSMRVLASYDRVIGKNITIGGRVGFAFNGGPAPAGGNSFLPLHLEPRIGYWFGQDAFSRKGLRPFIHGGGGLAQVDAKLTVKVRDCGQLANGTAAGQTQFDSCVQGNADPNGHAPLSLDAYKKLGQGFISVGGGAMWAFSPNVGVVADLNLMIMLPSSGFVIQPNLGVMMGI